MSEINYAENLSFWKDASPYAAYDYIYKHRLQNKVDQRDLEQLERNIARLDGAEY